MEKILKEDIKVEVNITPIQDSEKPEKPTKEKQINEFLHKCYNYDNGTAAGLEALIVSICYRSRLIIPSDLTDYVSVAGEAITRAISTYDPDKGASFATFAQGVIAKKLITHVTAENAVKRGRGIDITYNTDINDTYGEGDDIPAGYIQVADPKTVEDVVFGEDVSDACQAYLDGLNKTQRQIADMLMDGDSPAAIRQALGLTTAKWESIWATMTRFDKKKVFYKKH